MKKFAIALLVVISFVTTSHAQYNDAIGLRGGIGSGLTYKHFISNDTAIEGILYSRWSGFGVAALMEHHNELGNSPEFRWFYGYGAHVGFYNGKYVSWGDETSYTVVGIDGILGIEYDIPNVPLAISVDWKPAFNLLGYSHFIGDGGAFSIRYTF